MTSDLVSRVRGRENGLRSSRVPDRRGYSPRTGSIIVSGRERKDNYNSYGATNSITLFMRILYEVFKYKK